MGNLLSSSFSCCVPEKNGRRRSDNNSGPESGDDDDDNDDGMSGAQMKKYPLEDGQTPDGERRSPFMQGKSRARSSSMGDDPEEEEEEEEEENTTGSYTPDIHQLSSLDTLCSNAAFMEDFETIRRVHSSSHSMLELCTQRSTGQRWMIKINNTGMAAKALRRSLRRSSKNPFEQLTREVTVLKRLGEHPNLVHHAQVVEDQVNQMSYIIMEFVEGGPAMRWNERDAKYDATSDYMVAHGLDARTVRSYFRDAVGGLEHIHRVDVIHRDLKPENMLTTRAYRPETPEHKRVTGRLKIADFGVSRLLEDGLDLISDTQGTNLFEAPESFTGEPYSGRASDIWALGVSLYAFAFQDLPFYDESPEVPFHLASSLMLLHLMPKRKPDMSPQTEDCTILFCRRCTPSSPREITLCLKAPTNS